MYSGASNFVQGVDTAFAVIFGISFFFLFGLTGIMIYFIIKYNRKRNPKATQIKDNNKLEIAWTIIPFLIVMLMFYYGYIAFLPQRNAPKDAISVTAVGKMWVWSFEYPNGIESKELTLPLNKAVILHLKSLDVIHSLYIPAFRIKEDVVPGKNNFMWFIPEQLGTFDILCAEYCGMRHSYMESLVHVLPQADFDKWYAKAPVKKTEPEGLVIIKNNACTGCHSLDGTTLVSKSFKGLYGKKETVITDGTERQITVNDDYISESILDPNKDIVKGFNKGIMKSYKGVIKDADINKIIEYLKSAEAK
jgi:cytochrome c oxidase subunit II